MSSNEVDKTPLIVIDEVRDSTKEDSPQITSFTTTKKSSFMTSDRARTLSPTPSIHSISSKSSNKNDDNVPDKY